MHIVRPRSTSYLPQRVAPVPPWRRHRFISTNTPFPLSYALEEIKKPSRRGQNLTERHKRLANSVRGKDSLSLYIQEQNASNVLGNITFGTSSHSALVTFRGFTIKLLYGGIYRHDIWEHLTLYDIGIAWHNLWIIRWDGSVLNVAGRANILASTRRPATNSKLHLQTLNRYYIL